MIELLEIPFEWIRWMVSRSEIDRRAALDRLRARKRKRTLVHWLSKPEPRRPLPSIGLICPLCDHPLAGVTRARCPVCNMPFDADLIPDPHHK